MEIDFNPELFNDIYWLLSADFDNEAIRYIYLYGGSSASKTFTVVQLLVVRLLYLKENTMVIRKFGVDIKDSIYSDFVGIINDWGLAEYFKIHINYIECLLTGAYIRFRGLDDAEKIKGLAGFKRVVYEEISQGDFEDLKQIRKRLRGQKNQQIIGLFNPIDETHWLKEKVFDLAELKPIETEYNVDEARGADNIRVYKVTYLNNYFITGKWVDKHGKIVHFKEGYNPSEDMSRIGGFVDKHTIEDFEKDKKDDFNYYQIYGLGNWGKIRTGGEFWKDFNTNKHVINTKLQPVTGQPLPAHNFGRWNKDLPIHLSFDENVNPYLTCLVWQINGRVAVQIDEICLPDPRNRIHFVCDEFKQRYRAHEVKGLFLYGDRTSIKEDTKLEKGVNFFHGVAQGLAEYRPRLRMQSVNPSVAQSGGFINEIYRNNFENISIFVADICKKSIFDYQYALEDSDGTIKKTKKTDPSTKVSYEEFGHISDALRYFITVAFANEYVKYLKGGKATRIAMGRSRSKSGY